MSRQPGPPIDHEDEGEREFRGARMRGWSAVLGFLLAVILLVWISV